MNNLSTDKKVFEELKLVVFKFINDQNGVLYALNAHKVREVVEFNNYEPLPSIYKPYVGILNLRGIPVPILDLESSLFADENIKNEGKIENTNSRLIVFETLGKMIGMIVQSHIEMQEFDDSDVVPPVFTSNNIKGDYISGLIQFNQKYIFMLNVEDLIEQLNAPSEEIAKHKIYQNKSVLVVEDSDLYRKKLFSILSALGFTVHFAKNGIEGLELLKKDSFDIIFCDIEMPGMNGIEMVRKMKGELRILDTPVLFHSSISNESLISQLTEENLGDYLNKFSEKAILEKLKIWLS